MPRDRIFAATILALLLLTAVLHVLGADPLRESFWGVHQYGFWHPSLLVVATMFLLASGLLLRPGATNHLTFLQRWPTWESWSNWRRIGALALPAVAAGVLFWLGRTGHVILGDGSILVINISHGEAFHPREPLTAILQQGIYRLASGLFTAGEVAPRDVVHDSLALGSVLAGVLFVPVVWFLARELVALVRLKNDGEDEADWSGSATVLTALVILSQGYILLFCGYVENYTFYTLASGLYLWLALRSLRIDGSLLPPAVALILALCLHLAAAVFLPSFLVLIAHGLFRKQTFRATLRELAAGVVLVLVAAWMLSLAAGQYNLFATLVEVTRLALLDGGENVSGYLLSANHLRDFINEQLLIGPLGLFLYVPAAVIVVKRGAGRHPAILFLLTAGLAHLAVSWLAGESNLGYARNWDLLAPGSLTFTAAGLGMFYVTGKRLRLAVPLVLCALVVSLYHTVPWVTLNSSFERSFARLKTLPSSRGITEANVARWYLLQGDREQGKIWLQKALVANPYNNNAYYMLSTLLSDEENYTAAAEALRRAVSVRPDKTEYRQLLVQALLAAGAFEEARSACEVLLSALPEEPRVWEQYGLVLMSLGRDEEARRAFARVKSLAPAELETAVKIGGFFLKRGNTHFAARRWIDAIIAYEEALAYSPGLTDASLNLGYALVQTGRNEEAVQTWRQVLAITPDSILMLLNLGSILHALGRDSEVSPCLERALLLDPTPEQAEQIGQLLAEIHEAGP